MRKRLSKKKILIVALAAVIITMSVFLIPGRKGDVSFYYWKQSYALDHNQEQLMKNCQSKELFVKFFDVAISERSGVAEPVSIIEFKERPTLTVIPCIYIRNDVFKAEKNPPALAKNIHGLIKRIAAKNKLNIREIQLDCDWSNSTRQAYFNFLSSFKKMDAQLEVTCTIRLHQIKYQKETGVPPVKKGVLMCYNMDDLDKFNTDNSIISTKTLKQYISSSTSYPIELDLALPIYQWGLVFRLGKLSLIANDIPVKKLKEPNYTQLKPNVYQVNKTGYLNDSYVCKGDLIRLENSSPETLTEIAEALNESELSFKRLILFHISQQHITQFDENNIQKIRRLIP